MGPQDSTQPSSWEAEPYIVTMDPIASVRVPPVRRQNGEWKQLGSSPGPLAPLIDAEK